MFNLPATRFISTKKPPKQSPFDNETILEKNSTNKLGPVDIIGVIESGMPSKWAKRLEAVESPSRILIHWSEHDKNNRMKSNCIVVLSSV